MTVLDEVGDWFTPARPSISLVRTDDLSEIICASEDHFYVTFRQDHQRFDIHPDASSIEYTPGQAVSISIDAEVYDDQDVRYIVVEYTEQGRYSHSYSGPAFVHPVSKDATALLLAVRVKGAGKITLGNVSVHAFAQADAGEYTRRVSPGDNVSIRLSSFAIGDTGAGVILVGAKFYNSRGELILPEGDSPINPRIGAYKYVEHGTLDDPRETLFELRVPAGADSVSFSLIRWKGGRVYLTEQPTVTVDTQRVLAANGESIQEFLESIPQDDTLIVLYTTAPQLGHPTLALRPNRLTKEYLKLGCWVVFFPFSRVPSGEENQGPKVRQYSRDHIGEFLSACTTTRKGRNNIFICSSFPDVVAVGATDLLAMSGWTTVYEVRDDMEEFNRVGYSKWFHPQLESRVTSSAHKVITVSPRLARKMDVLKKSPGHAVVVPNAVDEDFIVRTAPNRSSESYSTRSDSVTVGYIGHLTASWFDWPLVASTAEQMPEVTFEIIGHGQPDELVLPENVRCLGPKTHEEFQAIALGWKVGIIPFKPSTLTYAVDPNKVYEYLAVGLRTVTARMGSVHLCPSTWIYDKPEDFKSALLSAIEAPFSEEEAVAINEFLKETTWANRAQSMLKMFREV